MTGDENRKVIMHYDKKTETRHIQRASIFVFPACTDCNTAYSKLEKGAKHFVESLFSCSEVKEDEFSLFFDWLDKVRVGLWLADIQRNSENVFIGSKNFHINDRVGQKDRCLFLLKAEDYAQGFNIIGNISPIFHYWPSAFGLRINEFYFVSISSDFLISHRMGLAKFDSKIYGDDNKISVNLSEGNGRIKAPFLDIKFIPPHLSYFQSCYPTIGSSNEDSTKSIYLTDYGKKIHLHDNKFKIYLGDGRPAFPHGVSSHVVPTKELKCLESDFVMPYVTMKVLEIQEFLAKGPIDYFGQDKEAKERYKHNSRYAINYNRDGQIAQKHKLKIYKMNGERKHNNPWD